MKAKSDRQKRTRETLRKQIAVAPTHAKKWELALHGGTILIFASLAASMTFTICPQGAALNAVQIAEELVKS